MRIRNFLIMLCVCFLFPLTALAQTGGFPLPTTMVIQPNNARNVVELARCGRGSINVAVWSPDARWLALGGDLGIWLYDANNLLAAPHHFSGFERPV